MQTLPIKPLKLCCFHQLLWRIGESIEGEGSRGIQNRYLYRVSRCLWSGFKGSEMSDREDDLRNICLRQQGGTFEKPCARLTDMNRNGVGFFFDVVTSQWGIFRQTPPPRCCCRTSATLQYGMIAQHWPAIVTLKLCCCISPYSTCL
jgi:hypothetical protein